MKFLFLPVWAVGTLRRRQALGSPMSVADISPRAPAGSKLTWPPSLLPSLREREGRRTFVKPDTNGSHLSRRKLRRRPSQEHGPTRRRYLRHGDAARS